MLRRGRIRLEEQTGDEFSGVKRVLKVLSGIDGNTLKKIDTAHDHKGTLFVSWIEMPNDEDLRRVESAWSSECECLLQYTYPNGSEFAVQTGTTVRQRI